MPILLWKIGSLLDLLDNVKRRSTEVSRKNDTQQNHHPL
jgi:hypothetical protein